MKRALAIISIIISPFVITLIAGIIVDHFDGDKGDAPYGLATIAALFIGIPLVAIVGLVVSLIVRNKPNCNRLSLIGYVIPAIIISGVNVLSFLSNIS